MPVRTELNARIGRTMPSPLFGVLVATGPATTAPRQRSGWLRITVPRGWWMPAALAGGALAALIYGAVRSTVPTSRGACWLR
jgi:hypothetical protein